MSLFGSRVILASVKGQFWKSESKSNFKRLSLLKKKGELDYEKEGRKERKERRERRSKKKKCRAKV